MQILQVVYLRPPRMAGMQILQDRISATAKDGGNTDIAGSYICDRQGWRKYRYCRIVYLRPPRMAGMQILQEHISATAKNGGDEMFYLWFVNSHKNIQAGDFIAGQSIPARARVTAINNTTVTLNLDATATLKGVRLDNAILRLGQ